LYLLALVFTIAVIRQSEARRRVEALYRELEAAHQQLQQLHAQGQELAVTQERNRLAREIHDSLAHYLTVINLQLEAAEKLGRQQAERAIEHVQRARRLTVDCLQDVRRSVAALRAPTVEGLALPELLRKLAEEFGETTGLRVTLDVQLDDDLELPPDPTLVLFRAAQEGLTNVRRHAQATAAGLTLRRRDGFLDLVVDDNGVGPGAHPSHEGFGLTGLQERADLVGGQVSFGPLPEGGARLIVSVPVH
jgi:signal transduction histidine kinase